MRGSNKCSGHQQFALLILRGLTASLILLAHQTEAAGMLYTQSCSRAPPERMDQVPGNRALTSVFVQSCTSDANRRPGIRQAGSPDSQESYPRIWAITTEMECNWLYYVSIKGLILIQLKYEAASMKDFWALALFLHHIQHQEQA